MKELNPRDQRIARLYTAMPDAPMVPLDRGGFPLWGEVSDTDHWTFCERIIEAIDAAAAGKGGDA